MKNIFKYTINPHGNTVLPIGHRLLKVGVQGDDICLWVMVDPDAELAPFNYQVIATGGEVPEGAQYIDTVFMDIFVWHIYGVRQ